MDRWLSSFVSFLLFLLSFPAQAQLLQIIHTNDLHSHFEHAESPLKGGYAAVKAKIDELKAQAQAQGIDTLVLDAGDFSEGTQFYLADQGEDSWRMLDAMGYDAVVIGNHDYLMGQDDLDRLIGHVKPGFKTVCANFEYYRDLKNLVKYVKPHAEFRKAGVKIAVVGFTTDDFEYRWRVGQLVIDPPAEVAKKVIPKLKARNDFVFALTHIGWDHDQQLARENAGLDLVVGGHYHTYLTEPIYEKNPAGHAVPIVQAGDHGSVVGDLLVDLVPGREVKVLRYQLVPVPANGPKDERVNEMVIAARHKLESSYGADWLAEVIGYSDIPLIRPRFEDTPWGRLVADAMRESAHTDVTVDNGDLFGDAQPAGPVTRERLFAFYPRVFGFDEHHGWTVWTTKAQGWVLKFVLQTAIRNGIRFSLSNLTYDVTGAPGKEKLKNVKIAGQKLKALKTYTAAVPEGIGRAIDEIIEPLKLFLRKPTDTYLPIWLAVEAKLRQVGTVHETYPDRLAERR